MPSKNAYITIPPPPLAEFYRPKRLSQVDTASKASSSCVTGNQVSNQLTARSTSLTTRHLREIRSDAEYLACPKRPAAAVVMIPPNLMCQKDSEELPFTVYHVCRICHRPRSERYHREHPIPVDGVPPPPGICRRCRVTPADESKAPSSVVETLKSSDVRLRLKCLVPPADCLERNEQKLGRAASILSQAEWEEIQPEREKSKELKRSLRSEEITYRHFHTCVPPSPPALVPVEPETPLEITAAGKGPSLHNQKSQSGLQHRKPTALGGARKARMSPESNEASHLSNYLYPQHHTPNARDVGQLRYSEHDIRKVARDEVERYRQAERKIEAHLDPYAHGKLVEVKRVPLEKRIELREDVITEKSASQKPAVPYREPCFVEAQVAQAHGKDRGVIDTKRRHNASTESPARETLDRFFSPPSSKASDKTRWPAKQESCGFRRYGSKAGSWGQMSRKSIPRRYNFVEVVEEVECRPHNEPVETPDNTTKQRRTNTVRELPKVTGAVEDQRWSEHQAKAPIQEKQPKAVPRMTVRQRDANHSRLSAKNSHGTSQHETSVSRRRQLPYPEDDEETLASMPLPHADHNATAQPNEQDREYYYVRHVVTPASQQRHGERYDDYYRETEEVLFKRRATACPPSTGAQPLLPGLPEQPSNINRGRVRFSKKVGLSPTPPGSDESSSQLHDFYTTDGRLIGEDKAMPRDYEHRGRTRNHKHIYRGSLGRDRNTFDSGGHSSETAEQLNHNQAAQSSQRQRQRQRRLSDDSAPSTLQGDVKRWTGVLSESPSREKLREEAVTYRIDGAGPYRVEEVCSASMQAEDGSTTSKASSYDRYG